MDVDGDADADRDPDMGMVGKLTPELGAVAHELWMANRVRIVDPESRFTLVPEPGWCGVAEIPEACDSVLALKTVMQRRRGQTPTMYRLLMPYGGVELYKTPPSRDLFDGVRTMLKGLRKLLFAGVAHGDLHCSNLLVDDAGVVRIIDFGLGMMSLDPKVLGRDVRLCLMDLGLWASRGTSVLNRLELIKLEVLVKTMKEFMEEDLFHLTWQLPKVWAAVWDNLETSELFANRLRGGPTKMVRVERDRFIPRGQELNTLAEELQRLLNINDLTVSIPDPGRPPIGRVSVDSADAVVRAWSDFLAASIGDAPTTDDVLKAQTFIHPLLQTRATTDKRTFWLMMVFLVPVLVCLAVLSVMAYTFADTKPVVDALSSYTATLSYKDKKPISAVDLLLDSAIEKRLLPDAIATIIKSTGFYA